MLSKSDTFKSIRKAIDGVPVIDCHEHTKGYRFAPEYKKSITSLIQGYVQSDLVSAGGEPHMTLNKKGARLGLKAGLRQTLLT